jgi:DNA-binding MarR family transcriptional regulator
LSLQDDIKASSFPSLEEKTFVNLLFTTSHLEAKFNQFIKGFGLSTEQYKVLRILRGQYPNWILSGDLQSLMLRTMSNSTRLVDKLVEKDLVIRKKNPEDKRQITVSITNSGLDLLKDIIKSDKESLVQLNDLLDELRDLAF